jgi:hypothetical protein
MGEMRPAAEYSNRFVAFVDILGFSEAVRSIEATPKMFERIRSTQVAMRNISEDPSRINLFGSLLSPNPQITGFSDCIVISAPDQPFGLWYVAVVVLDISRLFLSELGLMIRGGLSYGPLYHQQSSVFGRAFLEAYELERDIARHPRVVVSPKLVDRWRGDTEGTPVRLYSDLLVRDSDGVHYIDLFHTPFNAWEKRAFDMSRVHLDQHLREPKSRYRDWTKVAWLANRYNEAVKRLGHGQAIDIPQFPPPQPHNVGMDISWTTVFTIALGVVLALASESTRSLLT